MSFIPTNNRNSGIDYAKKASTAFLVGQAVQIDGTTGLVEPADMSTPIVGICNIDVDVSDATNDFISITKPMDNIEFEISADSATAAMVGRYVALNATGTGIVVAGISTVASLGNPVLVTKFISATEIIGEIAFKA